jgi:chromosome transmission fidelity protein 18
MGALKNNGRFKNSYITYNKLQPDIVIGLIDPNCVADKPNRNGENGVDNDYDYDQGNNVNEIRAMPYIKVFESVLRLSQQRELRELKRLQELGDEEDGDEDDGDRNKRRRTGTSSPNAGGVTSGASSASDRGAEKQGSETTDATAVDTFKRKYSTFHMHLSGKSGGVNIADNGRSVMAANENRIWVKYNEGFSNAVRKELVWKDLF